MPSQYWLQFDFVYYCLELGGLIKFIRPFLKTVSKAKAAKLVRNLVDVFLDMEASTGMEVHYMHAGSKSYGHCNQNHMDIVHWFKVVDTALCPGVHLLRNKKNTRWNCVPQYLHLCAFIILFCFLHCLVLLLHFNDNRHLGPQTWKKVGQYSTLLYGWQRVQARWSKSCMVIDGAILPTRDCLVSMRNYSQ